MKNKSIAIALGTIVIIGALVFGFNNPSKNKSPNINTISPTSVITPTTAPTSGPNPNLFTFGKANKGDRVGEMQVESIKTEEGYITVTFDGKVTISGDYISDYSGMSGQYITLSLDEESVKKIPYEKEQSGNEIVLDPVYQTDKALLTQFGKTGTKGKFKIEIDNYYVTNWIESIPRVARIAKVIEVSPNK